MMNNRPWYVIVGIFLGVLTLLFVLGYALYRVRAVLPPFVIAIGIAWLLDPLLDRLQKYGFPRIVAVTAVFAIFLAAFVVTLIFVIPAVVEQGMQFGKDYPNYADGFRTLVGDFMAKHQDTLVKFHLPTTLQGLFTKYGDQANNAMTTAVSRVSNWIVANVSKALWFVLIPLISFYLLNDIDRVRAKVVLFIPLKWRPKTVEVLSRMGTVFSNYVRGLTIVGILYGLATTAVLLALHLKYGIIIGVLAGILYAVPYLGAITTAVLVFLVGLATYDNGLHHAIWTTVAVMVTNQVFDLVISPRILGKSVGLHPALSMFALLAGNELFGLPGMILAVPLAASIQEIVFEFYPELRAAPTEERHPAESDEKADTGEPAEGLADVESGDAG